MEGSLHAKNQLDTFSHLAELQLLTDSHIQTGTGP